MNENDQVLQIIRDMFGNQGIEMLPVPNPCSEQAMGRMQRCSIPAPKPKYDDQVKFSFYGCLGKCNHHTGVIVVASAVDKEKGVCFYGVAYCSPEDIYSKEKGKELAHLDLIRNMKTVALGKKAHHEINARIFCDIIANNDEPSWARDKVASILRVHLEKSFNTWVR